MRILNRRLVRLILPAVFLQLCGSAILLIIHLLHDVAESLTTSHNLQPNPHAARALALLAPTAQQAWNFYLEGWSSLQPQLRSSAGKRLFENSTADPLRDVVMDSLVREVHVWRIATHTITASQQLTLTSMTLFAVR